MYRCLYRSISTCIRLIAMSCPTPIDKRPLKISTALSTRHPLYLVSAKGSRRVWPVNWGCLLFSWYLILPSLLLGVWVAPHLTFICVYQLRQSIYWSWWTGVWIPEWHFFTVSLWSLDFGAISHVTRTFWINHQTMSPENFISQFSSVTLFWLIFVCSFKSTHTDRIVSFVLTLPRVTAILTPLELTDWLVCLLYILSRKFQPYRYVTTLPMML
jgi:hypothetical protein